jgi:hypothetical protein
MEVTSIKTKEFLLPFHFKSCFEKSSLSLLGTLPVFLIGLKFDSERLNF